MAMNHQYYRDRRVLVTGGAGFIGSHLTDALVALGAQVRVLDDLSAGRRESLASVADRVDLQIRSVADADAVDAAVTGCDLVFHLAANASVPLSSEQPQHDFQANAVGTHGVLDAVRRLDRPRLVFASSAAVYGEPVSGAMAEDHPLRPQSPYGGSKLAGEYLCVSYGLCYDLDIRRARIFNTYGPRQRRYVMYDLLEKLRRDPQRLEVIGTGEQKRDYCYVADTVEALLLLGSHDGARGEAYNVAGGRPVTIRELVEALLDLLDLPRPVISFTGQSWVGDVMRMTGDIGRLRGLDWEPVTDLGSGLDHLIDWHRKEFQPPW